MSSRSAPRTLHLHVNTLSGKTFEVTVPSSATVRNLRGALADHLDMPESFQLLHADRVLARVDMTLDELGVLDGATLTLALNMRAGPVSYRTVRVSIGAEQQPPSQQQQQQQQQQPHAVDPAAAAAVMHALQPILPTDRPFTFKAQLVGSQLFMTVEPAAVSDAMDATPASATATAAPAAASDAANDALKRKVEQIKEQLRLKRLQRERPGDAAIVPSSPSPARASALAPAPSAPASSAPFAGLRRGFLLAPSPRPVRRASISSLPSSSSSLPSSSPSLPSSSPSAPSSPLPRPSNVTASSSPSLAAPATPAASKPRCSQCSKKLGLTGAFACRCGRTFCAAHKFSGDHACTFDYRALAQAALRRANPTVVAPKVQSL